MFVVCRLSFFFFLGVANRGDLHVRTHLFPTRRSSDLGAQATLLTTINALDPIYFVFDASEALFLKAKRAEQAGDAGSPVEVKLQDETAYRWKGRLDFTDNGLDPRSGTIRVRAVVDNPELFQIGRASCREREGQYV